MGVSTRLIAAFALALACAGVAVPIAALAGALAPTCTKTGSTGADILSGTAGPDVLCGLGGNDKLRGLGGDDILIGGSGIDRLEGGEGADRLFGEAGNDTLIGGIGPDLFSGGTESDLVRYDTGAGPVFVSVGHRNDDGGYSESDDVQTDIERVWGTSEKDAIANWTSHPVQFRGLNGDDQIVGGPAADILEGGSGHDRVRGWQGSDTIKCGTGQDGRDGDASDVVSSCEQFAPNRPPTAVFNRIGVTEDDTVVVSIDDFLAHDYDVDYDPIRFVGISDVTIGTAVIEGQTVRYTPPPDFEQDTSFQYTVSDGELTSSATVYVHLEQVNDPPVAVDDVASTKQDQALAIPMSSLLANDHDVDDQSLRVTAVSGASNGSVQLDAAYYRIIFTPSPGYCGPAAFDYTVIDWQATDVGHVLVDVECPPPPPPPPHIIVGDEFLSGTEDTQFGVPLSDLLANDVDVDGHSLTITEVASGMYGEVSLEGDRVVWQPEQDYCGDEAWFAYLVSDGTNEAIGIVSMDVECVNDPPFTWLQWDFTEVDTPLVFEADDIEAYDIDSDVDSLIVARVENPLHGTVSLSNGVITFTPAPGFCGDAGFDFVVSDGELETTEHYWVIVDGPGDC